MSACALASLPLPAFADPGRADALFLEGRRLLANGQIAEACDKFAESQREDPSSGALLNLARCHAEEGMTATAWAEYLAASHLARNQHRPQQAEEAELRAAELQPRLMRLLIRLDAQSSEVAVTRNGEPLAPSELGKPIPVDPGSYTVRATAPGRAEWMTSVPLTQPGQIRVVVVPSLAPLESEVAPPPPPTQPAVAPQTSAQSAALRRSTAAPSAAVHVSARTWIAGGLGAAALVGTGALAAMAKSKWDDAHRRGWCDAAHACNREGLRLTDDARHLGNLATATAAVGIGAFASAVLFYAADLSSRGAPPSVGVSIAPGVATLDVHGGF